MLGIERHGAGVQTTRRFRAGGEDASPKDSPRQGIKPSRKPTPRSPASGQAKPRLEPTGRFPCCGSLNGERNRCGGRRILPEQPFENGFPLPPPELQPVIIEEFDPGLLKGLLDRGTNDLQGLAPSVLEIPQCLERHACLAGEFLLFPMQ